MKKVIICLCILSLFLSLSPISSNAAVTGDAPMKGNVPLLITNAGQGPGGKMGRLLVTRSKAVTDFKYLSEPWPEDIKAGGFKTIMVIIGSSAKGLGASGITIDEEITRLDKIMESAKADGLQIIACHIEGNTRRGKPGSADERSIDAIAPFAHAFIVKKDSNEDGRFTELAKTNGVPLTIIDETLDFMKVVQEMYQ
ncbi:MAG: DUF6305 family protein [Aminobacterium sp.]|uniref:DUF6305 family protein n=1 Tax=Aminobacterium sp. TaxID=1872491 RepID=UPI002B206E1B|nr:DUF6305 family protein [Aminobacterium sp.]MEA4876984.1 DUF6305 family protein [Aminobacterium sp.]